MRSTRSSGTSRPRWLLPVLGVAYPAVYYVAGRVWSTRGLAAALLVLAAACWWGAGRAPLGRGAAVGMLGLAAVALAADHRLPLRLYPVAVNAALLALFGASLRFPPSAVERIARLQEPNLPAEAAVYTRAVTRVWCLFFVVNGLLALGTVVWGSDRVWFWYNGVIAYGGIGLLLGGERLLRHRFVRGAHG